MYRSSYPVHQLKPFTRINKQRCDINVVCCFYGLCVMLYFAIANIVQLEVVHVYFLITVFNCALF